uniref:Uncharacterized protein n=1 Tax=Chenopodium quinoa TaxID=63459 RepID=A0A803L037_CHEQI
MQQLPYNNFNSELIIENQLIIDLPRLDSPSLSTSFATKEAYEHHQQSGGIVNEEHHHNDHESSNNKWEILDNLLGMN